ncbi:hypothetical protein M427DRAFT_58587 [Gonapodya prolifera JEL478]|uniref:Uncharacterized protein n=1 Tax=Gonapodya prolifera (strain JEL478) TaxID=1344416 RepID=A0A139A9N6_GONPJ|nr:hypothetical protein M427DRAFT_58587 [Gonapodya prolifera JEL478]|eukprot:KXS13541.1 hypothetical protein M427DRAFT_58587 [Gonapodya prolifera JEL478]
MTGGVGGAALYVPLLLIFLAVDIHFAVPIASAMSLGYAIVILTTHRSYVDVPALALFLPYALAGSILGTYINLATPAYILCIVLAAQTAHTGWLVLTKAVVLLQRERNREAIKAEVRRVFDAHQMEDGLWVEGLGEDYGAKEMAEVPAAKKRKQGLGLAAGMAQLGGKIAALGKKKKEKRTESDYTRAHADSRVKSKSKSSKSKQPKSKLAAKSSKERPADSTPAPASWTPAPWLSVDRFLHSTKTNGAGGAYDRLPDAEEGNAASQSKKANSRSRASELAEARMQLRRTRGYGWEESDGGSGSDPDGGEADGRDSRRDTAKEKGFVAQSSSDIDSDSSSDSDSDSSESSSSSSAPSREPRRSTSSRALAPAPSSSAATLVAPAPAPAPQDPVFTAFLEDDSDDERGSFLPRQNPLPAVSLPRASMDSAGSLPSPPASPDSKKPTRALDDSAVALSPPMPTSSTLAGATASVPGAYPVAHPTFPYSLSATGGVGGLAGYPGNSTYEDYEPSHPAHFVPPVVFCVFICVFTAAEKAVVRKTCGGEWWFLVWFPITVLLGTGLILGAWLREDHTEEVRLRLRLDRLRAVNARATTADTSASGITGFDDTAVVRERIERDRAVATPAAYTVGAAPPGAEPKLSARQQAGILVGAAPTRGRGARSTPARPAVPQSYVQVNGRLVSRAALTESIRRLELEQPQESPFLWDTVANTVGVPTLAFVAGVVVATVGVGGGWLVAPYLVEVMKKPEPARATALASAVMVVLQAIVCFQYLVVGRLYWSYGLYFMLVAIASGTGGWYLTAFVVERLKYKSLLMFCLFGTMSFSVVWLLVNAFTHTQFSSPALGFSHTAACMAGRS